MFQEFPSLEDAKRWAKFNHRKLESIIEIDYFDNQNNVFHATNWVEGLPDQSLLIHARQQTKCNLTGKSVVFDTVFKTIQKQDLQEIWVNHLVAIN